MTPDALKEIFARAYSQAAMADANMREATGAFETIRERVATHAGYHDVLSTLEEQIGIADIARVVPALCDLRRAYRKAVVDEEIAKLQEAFSRDARAGWTAWVTAYVENFQENAWRTDIGRRFALEALVVSPDPRWPIDRIRRHDWLICRERWPEAYDWFVFLAEQPVPAEYRARMLAICAEIQLYRFTQRTQAEKLLERADEVCPGEIVVERTRAELNFEGQDIASAKRRYQAIAEKRPRLADGFLGQAECADSEGDAVAAEAFYQQAVRAAPGMTSGHRAVMNWHAKRIDEREGLIMSSFTRVIALSDDEAGECVNLGLLYKKIKRYQSAREWFKKAFDLQPDNGLAEIWAGHTDRDEVADGAQGATRDGLLASAEAHFQNDTKICGEALDGPWGMLCVAADRKDWAAARTWCDRCLTVRPEWESSILVRRSQISVELGDWAGSEADLVRSLDLEPQNVPAVDALLDLADRAVSNDRAKAEQVIARWLEHKGKDFTYIYENRLGNWDYTAGNYEGAARHYEAAVTAKPDRPVLRSNLALAAAEMRTRGNRREWLDRAIVSLAQAIKLDPKDASYRDRLAQMSNERDFIEVYGDKALEFKPTVTPLRLDVRTDSLPAILDADLKQLSQDTLDHINNWRTGFRTRMGMSLPGVNFTQADGLDEAGQFRMVIMERESRVGTIGAGTVIDSMLQQLDAFCLEHLDEFVGHQEAASLLSAIGDTYTASIVSTPGRLTKFVAVLHDLLKHALPLTDLKSIAAVFVDQIKAGKAPADIAREILEARSIQKGGVNA